MVLWWFIFIFEGALRKYHRQSELERERERDAEYPAAIPPRQTPVARVSGAPIVDLVYAQLYRVQRGVAIS